MTPDDVIGVKWMRRGGMGLKGQLKVEHAV